MLTKNIRVNNNYKTCPNERTRHHNMTMGADNKGAGGVVL